MTPKTLVFGSSSSKIFSLLDPSKVKIHHYSGATIRGLCRQSETTTLGVGDQIADEIFKYQANEIDSIVLFFGTVDAHITYYYKKIFQKGFTQSYQDYIKEVLECYKQFLDSFSPSVRSRFILLTPYPSIADKKYFPLHLKRYLCQYTDVEPLIRECFSDIDKFINTEGKLYTLDYRNKQIRLFGKMMVETLKDYNVVNIYDKLVDKNGRLKQQFSITQHPTSIHPIIWEEVLPLYYPFLENISQIKKSNLRKGVQQKYQDFLKSKEKLKIESIDEDFIIRSTKLKKTQTHKKKK